MSPQFNNLNEMMAYLDQLERRISALEVENLQVRALATEKPPAPPAPEVDGRVIARFIWQELPNSRLFSRNFLARSFAAWGHVFFAQLVITTVLALAYACVAMGYLSAILGRLIPSMGQ